MKMGLFIITLVLLLLLSLSMSRNGPVSIACTSPPALSLGSARISSMLYTRNLVDLGCDKGGDHLNWLVGRDKHGLIPGNDLKTRIN